MVVGVLNVQSTKEKTSRSRRWENSQDSLEGDVFQVAIRAPVQGFIGNVRKDIHGMRLQTLLGWAIGVEFAQERTPGWRYKTCTILQVVMGERVLRVNTRMTAPKWSGNAVLDINGMLPPIIYVAADGVQFALQVRWREYAELYWKHALASLFLQQGRVGY